MASLMRNSSRAFCCQRILPVLAADREQTIDCRCVTGSTVMDARASSNLEAKRRHWTAAVTKIRPPDDRRWNALCRQRQLPADIVHSLQLTGGFACGANPFANGSPRRPIFLPERLPQTWRYTESKNRQKPRDAVHDRIPKSAVAALAACRSVPSCAFAAYAHLTRTMSFVPLLVRFYVFTAP